ncbi:MAG TPA: HPr family phosphocarrier protein [Symbiobacteriaceae bacterium]|nr:HPr family phosphocarrier protein [Symbiobacteriaceae bacterium]
MVERVVQLVNPAGLHARPAAVFVQTAGRFQGTVVKVVKAGREVDCKSLLGILTLGAHQGDSLTIRADGPEEAAAVEALGELVAGGFGE